MEDFVQAMEAIAEAKLKQLQDRSKARLESCPDDFLWGIREGLRIATSWAEQELDQAEAERSYLAKTSQVSDTTRGTGDNHQEDQ